MNEVTTGDEQRPGGRVQRALNSLGPFLGLLLVVALFALLLEDEARKAFLSYSNLKLVLTQTVIIAIAAIGMTVIIISGGIDLSVGSVVAFTSVLGAVMIQKTVGLPWVVLAVVFAGGLVGCLNGSLIAAFNLAPFIVTLGMMGGARGAAKWLSNNQSVYFQESPIARLMLSPEAHPALPPPGVLLTIALVVVMAVVMRQTVFGRHVFALGSNEATARLCGIRTARLKILSYTLAGLFFGLAGLMQLSRLEQGDPSAAAGLELDVIAAVVIGGASLSGGTGTILGAMIGALIMAVLRSGSIQMGWPSYVQDIIIGAVIILAVGLDKLRQARTG